ncbi:Uncharacterised protein [Candidatus Venteria ishoeyi]|uniref:Uncharacterized protein n=1 Tax=Candidatus Venteria ishoeyi TaxID=1899563 RepID=A0A1H6F7M2_9GAMM|nr:Uncharacterised protein [Candidatus Venteria ishoeyi]
MAIGMLHWLEIDTYVDLYLWRYSIWCNYRNYINLDNEKKRSRILKYCTKETKTSFYSFFSSI